MAAFAIRLLACALDYREPASGLEAGYLDTVASIASGRGALMASAGNAQERSVIAFMKEREAAGGRIDPQHPFPQDTRGWLPATGHPPGYSLLLYLFYRAGNYTGMVRSLHIFQAGIDAFTCVLIFVFLRNLFGPRLGVTGAWIYALLPLPVSLTLQLLPDALSCFLAAGILALATSDSTARVRYGLLTGAAIGVASQFRAEFMIWPAVVLLPAWLAVSPAPGKMRFSAGLMVALCLALLPWIYWTKHSTGRILLTGTVGGGSMYETLGEDPRNPWGIRLLDEWIDADATRRGFPSAWTPEADAYYRAAFYSAIRSHPLAFVKLVAAHRLPLALVPPYTARTYTPVGQTALTERRLAERLSRWGVVWKYPGLVLKNMWDSALMMVISLLLLAGTVEACVGYRDEWRRLAWIVTPWLFTVASMCFLKQIEARNMAANIVVQTAACAVLVTRWRDGQRAGEACAAPEAARA